MSQENVGEGARVGFAPRLPATGRGQSLQPVEGTHLKRTSLGGDTRLPRLVGALAVGLTLALGAVACGGDDDKKTSEGSAKKTSEGSAKKTSKGSAKKTSEGSAKQTTEGSAKKTSKGSAEQTTEGSAEGVKVTTSDTADGYTWDVSPTPTAETKTVILRNESEEPHALVFARLGEGYTVDDAYKLEGKNGSATEVIRDTDTGPKQSANADVTEPLNAGDYVLLCPLAGKDGPHYKLGQLEEFAIK